MLEDKKKLKKDDYPRRLNLDYVLQCQEYLSYTVDSFCGFEMQMYLHMLEKSTHLLDLKWRRTCASDSPQHAQGVNEQRALEAKIRYDSYNSARSSQGAV